MNRRNFLGALAAAICAPNVQAAADAVARRWLYTPADVTRYVFWCSTGDKIVLPADFVIASLGIELPAEISYAETKRLLDECTVEMWLNKRLYFEGPLAFCYGCANVSMTTLAPAGSEIEFRSSLAGPFFVMNGWMRAHQS